jgi:hypothetical protein
MSKKIINQILGLAVVDEEFAQQLLKSPLEAIEEKGFPLTREEREALSEVSVSTLNELSQCLVEKLKYERPDQ